MSMSSCAKLPLYKESNKAFSKTLIRSNVSISTVLFAVVRISMDDGFLATFKWLCPSAIIGGDQNSNPP